MDFVAVDFETANYKRTSACAVGLTAVENGVIVERRHFLIRPPENHFVFTYLHGISWNEVRHEPAFNEIWPQVCAIIGNRPITAHNAPFDTAVLRDTLGYYGITCPKISCVCTCQLSRRIWPELRSHSLDAVAGHLHLALKHHNAVSDSEVCAQIALAGCRKKGFRSIVEAAVACRLRYDYLL